ncbi:MAG: DegT/DnrJ/EryC1/StrS family aminotransferase, partial [Chitinophagales bacterium]|nr:DegT/DnrJ/EryC1/StrS family aminotransferase [Chitinophagales bacterium]
ADVIWEKGTNRVAFAKGEIQKYNWVDIGSSFLMSELQAAYLFGQLEKTDLIQQKRKLLCDVYVRSLKSLKEKVFITIDTATSNASILYFFCKNKTERDALISFLQQKGILAVFHYLPLHLSSYYLQKHPPESLPMSEKYAETIVRIPLFYDLQPEDAGYISAVIDSFFTKK